MEAVVGRIELGFYDDSGGVQLPESYRLEFWDGQSWQPMKEIKRVPDLPAIGQMNQVIVAPTSTSKIRVQFVHRGNSKSGLTEIQVWKP